VDMLEIIRGWTTARDNVVRAGNITARLGSHGLITPQSNDNTIRRFISVMDERTAQIVSAMIADFGRDWTSRVGLAEETSGPESEEFREYYVTPDWSPYDREGLHELLMNVSKILAMENR
jgi:hypothetical protein